MFYSFRFTVASVLCFFIGVNTWAAQMTPLMASAGVQDEAALLAAAKLVEPVVLEGGYVHYTLVQARVQTWEDPKDLVIHLFLPPEAPDTERNAPVPVVVYVHGGGFIGGGPEINPHNDRSAYSAQFRALLDDGFAVASVGYRLARESGWPAPVSDALSALRFLNLHGKHWGVDGSRFALVGHSAGARSAALLGMVPQDAYHVQDLPWQEGEVQIAGCLLWAGSPLTLPRIHEWTEFGKPRHYSVLRLHFGEHPAHDMGTRHRLRIRNNAPHLSLALPPLHMVRGESDYGGDHGDAERAVRVWEALGVPVTLRIFPGGHSTTGPPEDLVAFMDRVLRRDPFEAPAADRLGAAEALLSIEEPILALEVLNAHFTEAGGKRVPAGQWLLLADREMMWLADDETWPEAARTISRRARIHLAQQEAGKAEALLSRKEWFRAAAAARNVLSLVADDPDMAAFYEQVRTISEAQARVFELLAAANRAFHAGEVEKAMDLLASGNDSRLDAARVHLAGGEIAAPQWAAASGRDVYGVYADLDLGQGVVMRFRHVAPGTWDLPEHLWYRNRTREPFTKQIEIQEEFWLAETPVTFEQWQAGAATDVEALDADRRDIPLNRRDYLQIVDWLQTVSGRQAAFTLRLPTEEEWLFAATLGGRDDVQAGTDLHAAHAERTDPEHPGPLPVRAVLPDLGGFYGMLGGVQEWTASPGRHLSRFTDAQGRFRVIAYPITRGGAWSSMPQSLSFEIREQHRHANRQEDLGFRPAIGGDADWYRRIEN